VLTTTARSHYTEPDISSEAIETGTKYHSPSGSSHLRRDAWGRQARTALMPIVNVRGFAPQGCLAALRASSVAGARPPVDRAAVCLVFAIVLYPFSRLHRGRSTVCAVLEAGRG
jgi:hypothetical protein